MMLQEDVKVVADCLRREVCEAVRLSGKEVVRSVREELDKQARYLSSILFQEARQKDGRPTMMNGSAQDERRAWSAPVLEASQQQSGPQAAHPHFANEAADSKLAAQPTPLPDAWPAALRLMSGSSAWTTEDEATWAGVIPTSMSKPSTCLVAAPSRVSDVSLPEEAWPPKLLSRWATKEGGMSTNSARSREGGNETRGDRPSEGWVEEVNAGNNKLSGDKKLSVDSLKSVYTMVNGHHVTKTADRIRSVRRTLNHDRSQLRKKFQSTTSSMSALEETQIVSNFVKKPSFGPTVHRFNRLVYTAMIHGTFDAAVVLILLANSIFIGIRVDMTVRGDDLPDYFRVLDVLFCLAFMIELGLRISVEGMEYFRTGEPWNYFDVLLVCVQVVDLILYFVANDETGLDQGMLVRILRILRLVRVIRLLRFIRFVSDLRKVVYLMMGSIQSFAWTMALLVLLMYILAVFFTQLIADNKVYIEQSSSLKKDIMQEAFGTLPRSLHTLYKSITGGMDWQDVSNPLIETINPVVGVIFAAYTAFAILVLLNLVTGVFVDGALKLSRADKEVDLTRKAYQVFKTTDDDDSGVITWDEFQAKLDSPEMAEFFEALEISMARAEDLFQLLDDSGDRMLDLEELVAGGLLLQGPAKAIDVAALFKYLHHSMERQEESIQWGMKRIEDKLEETVDLLSTTVPRTKNEK